MTIEELYELVLRQDPEAKRKGSEITSRGTLYLSALTVLPTGVRLTAGGSLYLRNLTELPEGISLSSGGALYLDSLTALPEGVALSSGGALYLGSLTALPDGVSLSAGSWLYLDSLRSEHQVYQSRHIRLRTIDEHTMRLISSRALADGVTLWRAQYFLGHLDTDPRCYVAQRGDLYAHGDTAEQALRDLRFKEASANLDTYEVVATIKARGTVTFNDYRLLTGACESGLREGLRSLGVDPDLPEMPLADALRLSRGQYGGDRFAELMGER
jgi:hypothetical protein